MYVTQRWLCPLRVAWERTFIKEGTPLVFVALLAMLQGKVETLLLGLLTDYDTVGQYQLAFRLVFTFFFVPVTVGQAFFPHLAASGVSAEARRLLLCGAGGLLGVGLLSMSIVGLWAAPLTSILYGPQSGAVIELLQPLTLLLPLSYLHLFFATVFPAFHQESKVLRALAIGTGTSVLANCVLIPRWGAYGAAYAGVVAAFVQLSVFTWHVWRLFLPATALAGKGVNT